MKDKRLDDIEKRQKILDKKFSSMYEKAHKLEQEKITVIRDIIFKNKMLNEGPWILTLDRDNTPRLLIYEETHPKLYDLLDGEFHGYNRMFGEHLELWSHDREGSLRPFGSEDTKHLMEFIREHNLKIDCSTVLKYTKEYMKNLNDTIKLIEEFSD